MEYVGFIDGAWERLNSGVVKSGMGGILMTQTKSVLYCFSGNLNALNSLDAEKMAMLYLYSQFLARGFK